MGIAVSLPLVLYALVQSVVELTRDWGQGQEMIVFLEPNNLDLSSENGADEYGLAVGQNILQIPGVNDVNLISADQALEDFKQQSGLGDLIDSMESNPLPGMLLVYPEPDISDDDIESMVSRISAMAGVDNVAYDQLWSERLRAIIRLLKFCVSIFACVMAVGVILMTGNTVRLGILSRSEEIKIIDQIGGTSGFIRRPFLYYGLMLGMFGAIVALGIANGAFMVIREPVNALAQLYDSKMRIGLVSFQVSFLVLGITTLLAWISARRSVGSYVRRLRASVHET